MPRTETKNLIKNPDLCISCAGCIGLCPTLALDMEDITLTINQKKCNHCNICIRFCPVGALRIEE